MGLGDTAAAVGRGLFAGVVGTAAMTISSTLEARIRGRDPSSAPADAAGKLIGVQPSDEAGKARFSSVVHWAYGTSWGAFRGIADTAGVRPVPATALHFAAIWGGAQIMLPALDVAPPAWEWAPVEIAIDVLHHTVYVVATGLAFAALEHASS